MECGGVLQQNKSIWWKLRKSERGTDVANKYALQVDIGSLAVGIWPTS